MKNKLIITGFTILLIILGVFVFLYNTEKKDRLSAENKYAEEKKEALRKLSDSLNDTFEVKTNEFLLEINYLSNLEQKIKYIPYEKDVYPNRTLDDALDVHSKRKANSKSRKKDSTNI